MIRYSSEVSINRPPADVFPWIVDLDKQAQWSDVRMQLLTPAPLAKGSRMRLEFGRPPLPATLVLEITALDADGRMAWTTTGKAPLAWDGEYRIEPAGEGASRLSQAGRIRFHGLWRLLEPILGAEIRRGEIREIEKLKALVEATTARATERA